MNSNRCPKCRGTANYLVTDLDGHSFYRCMTGLTMFERNGKELSRVSRIEPCDTITDDKGKVHTGTIAFVTGNHVETLAVTGGKERR